MLSQGKNKKNNNEEEIHSHMGLCLNLYLDCVTYWYVGAHLHALHLTLGCALCRVTSTSVCMCSFFVFVF